MSRARSVLFSLAVTTLGWLGYIVLYEWLFRRKIDWKHRPARRLFFAVLISGVYGVLLMVSVMKIMALWLGYREQARQEYVINSIYAALFTMLTGLVVTGLEFLKQWKKSAEDNERMKAEMIRSQYEALKNQVNPHFLFNSLNTLAAIIPEQPDVAVDFVQQLSRVFRYSLQYSTENLAPVATELKVVRSYLFLHAQRFGGKLHADIRISDAVLACHIITQSLLILMENAIKHNEISVAHPLQIELYDEAGYLVLRNKLRHKQIPEPSTGIGLQNIQARYGLVTAVPVVVEETEQMFTVKIPLICS
jgi:LytS/YehU family sensor histidine kinase